MIWGTYHLHYLSRVYLAEPPIFNKKPASQVLAESGPNLTLCCQAKGSVSWTRAQRSLNLSPAFQQNRCLTINNVKEESAGIYTCHATNSFGFAESTTAVIVTGWLWLFFCSYLSHGFWLHDPLSSGHPQKIAIWPLKRRLREIKIYCVIWGKNWMRKQK